MELFNELLLLIPHKYMLSNSLHMRILAMGNYISYSPSQPSGKVILYDGSVHEFHHPLTVAELMLEHPQQVVVEFQAAANGKKPTPLAADQKLDSKKLYLMLPMRRGGLSAEEARRTVLMANSIFRSRSLLKSSGFLPLFARICPAGVGDEVKEGFVVEKAALNCSSAVEFPTESLDGQPEYLNRQISGKGWKPSLDTIKEKKVEIKVPHWLF